MGDVFVRSFRTGFEISEDVLPPEVKWNPENIRIITWPNTEYITTAWEKIASARTGTHAPQFIKKKSPPYTI